MRVANRVWPAAILTPSSRPYSPAIALFSHFMIKLGNASSFVNVSAQ